MASSTPLPIACDLAALAPEERAREQTLLAQLRPLLRDGRETENGYLFVLPEDPDFLSRLGELLAYERLCCPFLTFDLTVPCGQAPVTLHVHGDGDVKGFVRSAFSV